MSRLECNVRIIILGLVTVVGSIFLAIEIIKAGKENGWFSKHFNRFKCITLIIGAFVSLLCLWYTICGIAYPTISVKHAQVTDVVYMDSKWGDTYTLYLRDDNGKSLVLTTMLWSSRQLKEKLEEIKSGDIVNIRYVDSFTSDLYYVEKSD